MAMTFTADDYIVQGEIVFFPVAGFRVNPRTGQCSCGSFECDHIERARKVAVFSNPEAGQWTIGQLKSLAYILEGSYISLEDGIAQCYGQASGTIDFATSEMDEESMDRLYELVGKCDQCEEWKDVDDMSEDVEGVCLDCVR